MARRPPPSTHIGIPPHTATQSLGFPACCDQALEQVSRVVAATLALPSQNRARAHNNDLQLGNIKISFHHSTTLAFRCFSTGTSSA
ncbi:hypothetical protein PMAYCL1PPCAC_12510 [Pristionchus mayeri]|uniref:Uncharacterized protein n=1 Tax=Pristionchus mayeri TaxID=1317129 RepID=A0AAN4ZSF0_9BILA|nr:hypothetical protein PMAYCL1PPCAC_12510 [Pristionchus mayeri]